MSQVFNITGPGLQERLGHFMEKNELKFPKDSALHPALEQLGKYRVCFSVPPKEILGVFAGCWRQDCCIDECLV